MNQNEQTDFALSLARRKLSLDSTKSSFKSKKGTFRKECSTSKKTNQIQNNFSNTAFKNNIQINKSRNINVGNLPICISQLTNLKNFNELSTKIAQKENKNSSINNLSSIDKDNNINKDKFFNTHSKSKKKNNNFKQSISRNGRCLVISDLLNSFNMKFDKNYGNGNVNDITKSLFTPEKEKSSLLLKLSPVRLKPNLRITNFLQSPTGRIKNIIRDIDNKSFLNKSNYINNNSSMLENNMSDINIIINKTNNKKDKNVSSFELYGNNISGLNSLNNNSINSTMDVKINKKKNLSGLNFSFRKLKNLKQSHDNLKINKNLFLFMNNSIFDDKKNSLNKNNIKPINKLIINNININKNKIINFQGKKNNYDEKVINEIKKIIIQKDKENKNNNIADVEKSFLSEKKRFKKNKTINTTRNYSDVKINNKIQFKDIYLNTPKNSKLKKNNKNNKNKNNNLDENENKISKIDLKKQDNSNIDIKEKIIIKSVKSENASEEKDEKIDKAHIENTENNISKNKIVKFKNDAVKQKLAQSLTKNNKLKLTRKNTIRIADYFNKNKKQYSHLIIKPKTKILEKYKFLSNLNKKIENNNTLNYKLFNSKAVILLVNTKKKDFYFTKKYNNSRNDVEEKLLSGGVNSFNIKILNKYKKDIREEIDNEKDMILEKKNMYTKCIHYCGTGVSICKYFCDKYEFEGIDSLKNKKDMKSRRNSIILTMDQINKILCFQCQKKKDNFPLLKTKTFFLNNEVEWKNTKTNFMFIHSFILKEHFLELNNEVPQYYSKRHNSDKLNNTTTCSTQRSISSFKNGLGSIFRNSGIIQFFPQKKFKRSSSSYIDLVSFHRRNSIKLEEKKKNNMNNYSILSSKKIFYNGGKLKHKYPSRDYLLNIKEVDDDSKEEEQYDIDEENKEKMPLILQFNENNCNIKNKGEFMLQNYKTIEDIYLGLSFLIIENKEKLFITKIEELKELIDINNQIFDGNTFLIIATREGSKNIIKFLCDNNCEMNIQNDKGNTALHYAIGNLLFDIVDILIEYGAKEDILNCEGLRPWDCIDHNLE